MSMNENLSRLDVELVNRNIATTRELAKKMILSSLVLVNGKVTVKPAEKVTSDSVIDVLNNDLTKYVSRGAYKLIEALNCFEVDVNGLVAVDFGASTGGFTDVLLQRGARKVYAIENGSGQLHSKLLNDDRVVSIENTNARYLEKGFLPLCDLAVMDVSFISQTKLYNSVTNVLKDNGIFISLIKPQFEAGKSALNKKGIVKDDKIIDDVVKNIIFQAGLFGLRNVGVINSPILGGDGNRELLACFKYEKE